MRLWDTRVSILEAAPFPKSIGLSCMRAFRAAPEGSTLSRVIVLDAGTLVTGDEENRLLKVGGVKFYFQNSPTLFRCRRHNQACIFFVGRVRPALPLPNGNTPVVLRRVLSDERA